MGSPVTDVNARMSELVRKFMARTAGEVEQMRACLARVDAGDRRALGEIHQLAHRACGTGGTLGLCSLSDAAGELERRLESLPADALPGPAERAQIASGIDALAATIASRG